MKPGDRMPVFDLLNYGLQLMSGHKSSDRRAVVTNDGYFRNFHKGMA